MSWGQFSGLTSWDYTRSGDYGRWNSDNTYVVESGKFLLPVAESPPTSQAELAEWSPVDVVVAHAPYSVRKMDFSAKKKGSPPVIPSPADSGPFTLLQAGLTFAGPSLSSSGVNYDWAVEGSYVFVQDTRFSPQDGFVLTGFPAPMQSQVYNQQNYSTQDPQVGPVSTSGIDVQTGYAQGLAVNLQDAYYRYNTPTYFPAVFLNADLTIGGMPQVPNAGDAVLSPIDFAQDFGLGVQTP